MRKQPVVREKCAYAIGSCSSLNPRARVERTTSGSIMNTAHETLIQPVEVTEALRKQYEVFGLGHTNEELGRIVINQATTRIVLNGLPPTADSTSVED